MKHHFQVRVYHADTDCYGIVWHGTYLRFCEQARCEFATNFNCSMKEIEDNGTYTPLVEVNLKYKNPAKVHDILDIETSVIKLSPIRATMLQKITNKETKQDICEVTVTFVCTDKNGKLLRKMPQELFDILNKLKQVYSDEN